MSHTTHFAQRLSRKQWAGGLCLLTALIAGSWYWLHSPGEPPAPPGVAIERPVNATPLPGAAQSAVAQSGAASAPVGCASINPFGRVGGACINVDLETADANDSIMTDEKLIKTMGVSHSTATEVLQVVPGASVRAMQTLKECRESEAGFERNKVACTDIAKVMHYVLLDLDFHAGNGNPQAALLMAEFYAESLGSTHEKNIPYFLGEVERYSRAAYSNYPTEVSKLQQLAQKYRT